MAPAPIRPDNKPHAQDWHPETLLKTLLGKWYFTREIPGHASMRGEAVFEETTDHYTLYREEGQLIAGDYTSSFFKEYLFEKAPGGFAVYFKEVPKRLFHTVILELNDDSLWHGKTEHQCLCDHYASAYVFFARGQFSITHQVKGPRKNYEIKTIYQLEESSQR
ncbi:MAG: hypothetical protein H2057_04565 [Alphaproteobacteria bacterium]|nr:hypothetical protein [Alphaproteobacteria bacterium]